MLPTGTTADAANDSQTQSLNRYAYALNNPTTLTDAMGLQSGDDSDCTWDSATATLNCPAPPSTSSDFGPGDPMLQFIFDISACLNPLASCPFPSTQSQKGVSPKPTPPGLQVSTTKLIVDVNRCAAQKADSVSAASLLGVQNNKILNTLFGSSTASMSRLAFGTNPSAYVPEGASLVAGAKVGTALTATIQTAGRIEVSQGFQSVFTTVAPTSFGQTAAGQALEKLGSLAGSALDIAGKGLFVYDTAAYIGSLVACTQ